MIENKADVISALLINTGKTLEMINDKRRVENEHKRDKGNCPDHTFGRRKLQQHSEQFHAEKESRKISTP